MLVSKGSLTIIDVYTSTPKIFWNGVILNGIISVRVFDKVNDGILLVDGGGDPFVNTINTIGGNK